MTTTIRLDPDIEQRLSFLAQETGRTRTFYLKQMIENGMDDLEDYYLAAQVVERIRAGREETMPQSELVRSLAWRIEVSATAAKQLSKIERSDARRITAYLRERVTVDPRRAGKALSGTLGDLWRYRVGNCRVICDIQDGVLTVLVAEVGHRKEVYR